MSTLYDRLGLQKGADAEEIKKAYHSLARQHHPDKGGDAETFKGVQEAYETLSDPQKRAEYDEPPRARMPFPDIFSMFGGMHPPQKMRKDRGPDSGTEPQMGLDAFYNGIEISMNFKQTRKCNACRENTETCSGCGGAGMCVVRHQMGPMSIQSQQLCTRCKGLGKVHIGSCDDGCRGARYIQKDKTITTKIPPGAQPGHSVVFPGEGSESPEYDTPGDVILKFRLTPSRYEWKGDDLHLSHAISFAESILGFAITLPDHPSRKQQVLTWSGGPVIHGTILTMEGKGMPRKGGGTSPPSAGGGGGGTGDLKLKLIVTQPPLVPWTAEQRTALESVFGTQLKN